MGLGRPVFEPFLKKDSNMPITQQIAENNIAKEINTIRELRGALDLK